MFCLRTRHLPPAPYGALTLGPVILLKRSTKLTPTLLRHETIHWRQCRELLIFGFYLWYALEWLFRLAREALRKDNKHASPTRSQRAYSRICFEREAYARQNQPKYLATRPVWAFLRYLR